MNSANLLRSERACIGCAVESPEILRQLVAELSPDDFTTSTHRRVWRGLMQMAETETPVDCVSLCAHLGDSEHDFAMIADCAFGVVVDASHAYWHAQQVRKSAKERRLLHLADAIEQSVIAGRDCDQIEKRVRQILDGDPLRLQDDFPTENEVTHAW